MRSINYQYFGCTFIVIIDIANTHAWKTEDTSNWKVMFQELQDEALVEYFHIDVLTCIPSLQQRASGWWASQDRRQYQSIMQYNQMSRDEADAVCCKILPVSYLLEMKQAERTEDRAQPTSWNDKAQKKPRNQKKWEFSWAGFVDFFQEKLPRNRVFLEDLWSEISGSEFQILRSIKKMLAASLLLILILSCCHDLITYVKLYVLYAYNRLTKCTQTSHRTKSLHRQSIATEDSEKLFALPASQKLTIAFGVVIR